ncbi:MAG TPA: polysaccharide biosynthesis tyrosine autokinase [Bryobacteraceae bacterium]|nr:polysaccharide biosynthesis tyrosine autokinase [Bryobacteraceae bacterium]
MERFRHLEVVRAKELAVPTKPLRAAQDRGPDGLTDYLDILWRSKFTVFSAALVSGLAAFLFTLPQTPTYQARTSLEIQGLNENFLHMSDITPNAGLYSTEGYVQTQVDVLQSRSLLRRTAQKVDFAKRALTPGDLSDDSALKEINKRLKVRTSPPTRIIRISFDSPDPRLAADFANALASEYVTLSLESRWTEGQNTIQLLSRQLEDLQARLREAEDRLQNYTQTAGLMFLADSKGTVAEDRLKQLQDEYSRAQAERIARQSEYEIAQSGKLESLPRVLDSERVSETQTKLVGLQAQLAELSHALTPQHYRIQRLKAQIQMLEAEMTKNRVNILGRIRNESLAAQRREKMLETAYLDQRQVVADQAKKTIQYDLLRHEVATDHALYDSLLQRVREAGIASAVRTTNVHVIDAADAPARPYKPDAVVNTALGLLTGMFAGLVFVCARANHDRRVRRPGEARLVSNTRELGVVPLSRGKQSEKVPLADSMRSMLTSLVFTGAARGGPRVIVVTSAGPSEGKTTIVRNLGSAMGEIAGRVLLVDADLYHPRLDALFAISNFWGLNNVLVDTYPVEDYPSEALGIACANGVYVLPSGPRCQEASELLYSARLAALLARLRREFDLIIIDTPPLLEMPDARILGRLADGVILVIRAGETSTDAVAECTDRLREDGTILLGTILNGWKARTNPYPYYRRRRATAED